MTVEQYVDRAHQDKASDVHLICGLTPHYRVDRLIKEMPNLPALTEEDCIAAARELAGEKVDAAEPATTIDISKTIAGVRCRISIFKQNGIWSIAIRLLNDHIPSLEELGLPVVVKEFATYGEGLVLVTGVTGSGKSTTLAALLDIINKNSESHIVTIEDPIEYVYTPAKSIINQRELGRDTKTYATGLHEALREDPDIILLGELRDLETIETALTAAETGHLVLATIHANSTGDAVDRIVGIFPGERQGQIRLQLVQTLRAVLNQNLFPRSGGGRVLACEVMKVNPAIKALIREGKTQQISNAILQSRDIGNVTMDKVLEDLYKRRLITQQIYNSFKSH